MTIRTAARAALMGAFVLLVAVPAAVAQGASISLGVENHDSSTPVEITSEELELNQAEGTAIFTGGVIVKQGGITMTCDRMIVEYGAEDGGGDQIRAIRMFGGVTFVSATEAAESNEAVYTLVDETLVMSGNVLVTQGATALSANRLVYNLQTGDGRMEGQVKTILQQGSN